MSLLSKLILFLLLTGMTSPLMSQGKYDNFKVAIYSRAYETQQMGDLEWLEPIWETITSQLKVDRIYLETHRDLITVDDETLNTAKKFFASKGVEVGGGITYTVNERNRFETFCYSNPEHRQKVKEIAEHTAKHFDEFILDDFFFTSCKCKLCIEAKGERSWTDYRLELMDKAARELVIEPSRKVNPDVEIVIKYPNWYEHFQGLGFNLETEPGMFSGLYTGTETRDPSGNQHLQAYLGYLIFRYFENLKPGENRGGWVDTGGMRFADRYAEQLWITMFAKSPEITLFDFRQVQRAFNDRLRAPWQDLATSFNYDEMAAPFEGPDGTTVTPSTVARVAGYTLEKVDRFAGELGTPVGVKSYKPYHSVGEDFLQTYLGMVGIPMDLVPEFPEEDSMILLTETAGFDPEIVDKIKGQLMDGKDVMITSGLLKALQGKGIEDIVELRYTDQKAMVQDFVAGWGAPYHIEKAIMIPQIKYLTNDSWEEISARDGTNGWPILHSAGYANGNLYVLTIPDSYTDLYLFPPEILTRIKETLTGYLDILLEAPGQVSLFLYDNNTFIVESFLDEPVEVTLTSPGSYSKLSDLETGVVMEGETREAPSFFGRAMGEARTTFGMEIKPHSYRAFRIE